MVAKRPRKQSGKARLFNRVNPNFTSGRYKPPSKNIAEQPRLFRSDDPYAGQSRVAAMAGNVANQYVDPTRSVQPVGAVPYGSGPVNIGQPVAQPPMTNIGNPANNFGAGSTVGDIGATLKPGGAFDAAYKLFQQGQGSIGDLMKSAGYQAPGAGAAGGIAPPSIPGGAPTAGAGLEGLQSLVGWSPEALGSLGDITASGKMNTTNPEIANAARGLSGTMKGNPFITQEGLLQMARGFAPDENQIDPAFYKYTSPVIQQMLQGLRTSTGYRAEDQAFTQQQFTPGALR